MSKLQSLAGKPATKDDIGKVVYSVTHYFDCPMKIFTWEIIEIFDNGDLKLLCNKLKMELIQFNRLKNLYWDKPVIISESEYNELKELLKEAVELIGKAVKDSGSFCSLSSIIEIFTINHIR